jgi:ribosome-associated protein
VLDWEFARTRFRRFLCAGEGPPTHHLQEAFLDSNTLARQIVDIVEEKQASDIVLLDIHDQTSIADYFVIATVDNERQAKAIEDELLQSLRVEQNIRPLGIEGVENRGGGWTLVDYGDVIVHLFTEEARNHYRLEELWNKAQVVVKVL